MPDAVKAAVLIATYNEAPNIGPLLEKIFAVTRQAGHDVTAVVVDDDSPDGTGAILDRLKGERYGEKLHVIHRKNQRGCGTARRQGFKYVLSLPMDCVVEMDGDGSHNPDYLPLFVDFSRHYDVVIGSRYVEGGATAGWPLRRKLVSRAANAVYRLILGTKIHDLSGGYKCYRRRVIEALPFDQFLAAGYAIGIETLYRCYKLGFSFLEIPVLFRNREYGSSKFSWKEARESLRIIFTLVMRYGRAIRLYDFEDKASFRALKRKMVPTPSSRKIAE
jgi:dolichol-phosphate mannosyltransferase